MGTLTLPVADWTTLGNLAFGVGVLQLGYGPGHDTVSLARTATMVVCMIADDDGTDAAPDRIDAQWQDTITAAGVRERTLSLPHASVMHARTVPKWWFDLAVINLTVLRQWRTQAILRAGAHAARTLAVIGAHEGDAHDTVLTEAGDMGYTATTSGSLLILTPAGGDQHGTADHL